VKRTRLVTPKGYRKPVRGKGGETRGPLKWMCGKETVKKEKYPKCKGQS